MIPTVILAGLIVGRWWLVAVAAIAWPLIVLAAGSLDLSSVPLAAGLAIVNAAVGVAPRWVIRRARQRAAIG